MKSWCKNLLAVGLSVALMSACSSSDVEEEPVSELVDIQATVFPEITWDTSVGDGVGDYYSQLRPTVRYGKVFVADRSGIVVAFDETTGDELWKKDFNDVFEDKHVIKCLLVAKPVYWLRLTKQRVTLCGLRKQMASYYRHQQWQKMLSR
jgi:outer membrane protein assembly factor BamB